jgi:hypothetical protein
MKKRNKRILLVLLVFLPLLSYSLLFILQSEKAVSLADEGNLIESAGALFLLVTAVLFSLIYWKSKSGNEIFLFGAQRNVVFLMLGIVFFVGFAEEISWGQSVFHYETPGFVKRISDPQKEFSIHNLQIFDRDKWEGRGIIRQLFMLNIARIFSIFWFFFCIVIPILNKYNWHTRQFLERIKLPIVPIWVGTFFALNYLALKLLERIVPGHSKGPLVEISETNFCFLFLVVSLYFFIVQRTKAISNSTFEPI